MCNNIAKLLDLMQEIEGDFKTSFAKKQRVLASLFHASCSYACLYGTQQAVSSLGIGRSCW